MFVALIERLQNDSCIEEIDLVCYENAPNILELLNSNLNWVSQHSEKKSLFNLRDAGEMVYIIPRSWTSRAYFKK